MAATVDRLLDQYERGQLNRRQLLKGLALATAGGALTGIIGGAEAQAQGGLAPAMSISHVHMNVRDLKRSAQFYSSVLGASPKNSLATLQTMYLPGAREGFGSWLSLDTGDKPRPKSDGDVGGKPGMIAHVGYGVTFPTSEFPRIAEAIKKRFPDVRAPSLFTSAAAGQELYFWDPDGISVQLIQIEHDGQLTGYDPKLGENRFVK